MKSHIRETMAAIIGAALYARGGWWGVAVFLLLVTVLVGVLAIVTPVEGDPR